MKFVGALSVQDKGVELAQDQAIIHALQDIETWWHQSLTEIKRAIQGQHIGVYSQADGAFAYLCPAPNRSPGPSSYQLDRTQQHQVAFSNDNPDQQQEPS